MPWFSIIKHITTDDGSGTIFQAKNGDLYVMGFETRLEVLKSDADKFVSAPGSKINNGGYGTIFQAKNGNLYVMESETGLELLKNNIILFFIKTNETAKGRNDGTITVTNGTDAHSQLQYKLADGNTWTNVTDIGRIRGLAPGTYQFQWKSKNGKQYINTNKTTIRCFALLLLVVIALTSFCFFKSIYEKSKEYHNHK